MAYFRSFAAFDPTAFDLHEPLAHPPVVFSHWSNNLGFPPHLVVPDQGWLPGYIGVEVAGFTMDCPKEFHAYSQPTKLQETAFGTKLTYEGGILSGGTVQMLEMASLGAVEWTLAGVAIGGADYGAALTSGGRGDDRALLAAAFAGDDHIILSAFADRVNAGAGRDLVFGGPGDDTIAGGAGNDLMDGLGDSNVMIGGAGNDLVFAGFGVDRPDDFGVDRIFGGSGDDTLAGGGALGVDTLTGGAGRDCFFFSIVAGAGFTVVTDFVDGVDRIFTAGVNEVTQALTFDDLTIRQGQQGAILSYTDMFIGGVARMLLRGVSASEITAEDFAPRAGYATMDDEFQAAYDAFSDGWDYIR